eukprot:COSAG02_NODE_215_length_28614_cov_43.077047_9_plen_32_part_00
MTSLPGAECGIGVELFDMCYLIRVCLIVVVK